MTTIAKVQTSSSVHAAPSSPQPAAPQGASALLPAPSEGSGDVMSMIYALTAKQRDRGTQAMHAEAQDRKIEREHAFERMTQDLQKAQETKDESGWIGTLTEALDAVTDHSLEFLLSSANPVVMAAGMARSVGEITGCETLTFAGGVLRPETLLRAASAVTETVAGKEAGNEMRSVLCDEQFCGALQTLSPYSTTKQRFEGAAKATGEESLTAHYQTFKQVTLATATTVATCGSGAVVAASLIASAALMLEEKAKLLEKLGVDSNGATGIRIGAQVAVAIGCGAAALDAGRVAGTVSKEVATHAAAARAAVRLIKGAETIVEGGVQVARAFSNDAIAEHMRHADEAQNTQKVIDRQQQRIIDGMRDLSQSYQRTLSAIAGTIQERDQTSVRLTQRMA